MKIGCRRAASIVLMAGAVIGVIGCGAGDEIVEELHVRFAVHDIRGDTIITFESGCIDVPIGADGAVHVDDPFLGSGGSSQLEITRLLVPHGLHVTATSEDSGGEVFIDKVYSPAFIRTETSDIIHAVPSAGGNYRVAHRGVPNCDDDIDVFLD